MFGDLIQPTHLLLVLIVALLVLGPKRLPEVGRSLGNGLRDFKQAMSTYHPNELLTADEPKPASPPPATPVPTTDTAAIQRIDADRTATAEPSGSEVASATATADAAVVLHPVESAVATEPADAEVVPHEPTAPGDPAEHPAG